MPRPYQPETLDYIHLRHKQRMTTKDIEEIVKQYEEIVADDFYQNKLATNWKQRKEWFIKKLTTLTQHHEAELPIPIYSKEKEI